MNKLYTVEEVAKYLNLKEMTIYNWLRLKRISGLKLGGRWRIKQEELDRILKEGLYE